MSKLKVLIDATVLTNQFRYRGVGNVAFSLLRQLLSDNSIHWQLMAPGTKAELQSALGYDSPGDMPTDFEFISLGQQPGLLAKLSRPLYFKLKVEPHINAAAPDIFVQLNMEYGLPKRGKNVVFIHDVIPIQTGVFSQKNFLANFLKGRSFAWAVAMAKQADRILTISNFTKQDLVKLGFEAEQITVAHLAVTESLTKEVAALQSGWETDEHLKRRVLNIYNITAPYIFYLGGLEANKNVSQLVRAFSLITDKYPSLKLVIGGGEFKLGWDHKAVPKNERAEMLLSLVKELKLQHKVTFTGFIESQHLPVIYKNASCFVHLSKYEGFGLNVLEPQLFGTPVLASDRSSYPEVLGESAVLVDPDNTMEVANQLSRLIAGEASAKELRNNLRQRGLDNLKRFSWSKTAATVTTVLRALYEEQEAQLPLPQSEFTPVDPVPALGHSKQTHTAPVPPQSESSDSGSTTAARTEVAGAQEVEPVPNTDHQRQAVILAAYFHPFVGGMEQVALDYAKFLVRLGFAVTVLTSDRKQGNIVIKKEEEYKFTDEGSGKELAFAIKRLPRKGRNYYFYSLPGLYKELKHLRPDFIHMHGFGFKAHDIAVWRYKNFVNRQVRVVNTPHGPFMSKPESGLRQVVKLSWNFAQSLYLSRMLDAVIAVNPAQYLWLKQIYRIPEPRIRMLTPLMPQPKLPADKLFKRKRAKDYVLITSISRLANYKGFEDIVAAFNEINTAATTKLLIAGKTDNFEKEIADLIKASPRRDDIIFERDITDKRRDQILSDTDIFVFASQWEAFGIVIAEAMSYGAAIISTTTEGGRFLVEPGKNGLLFEYKDLPQLIDKINKLINDMKLLQDMQAQSLEAVAKYSPQEMYKRYAELVKELGFDGKIQTVAY